MPEELPFGVLAYRGDPRGLYPDCYLFWCLTCFTRKREQIERDFPSRGNQGGTWNVYVHQVEGHRLACLDMCGRALNPESDLDFLNSDLVYELPKPPELFPEDEDNL